jgi:hypothetical protein
MLRRVQEVLYPSANSLSIRISIQLPQQSHLRIRQISPTPLIRGGILSASYLGDHPEQSRSCPGFNSLKGGRFSSPSWKYALEFLVLFFFQYSLPGLCPLAILQNHLIYNLPATDASPSPKILMGAEECFIDHQTTATMAIHGSSQIVFHLYSTRWALDLVTFYQILWSQASLSFLAPKHLANQFAEFKSQ